MSTYDELRATHYAAVEIDRASLLVRTLSQRDRKILAIAASKLAPRIGEFATVLAALREATEETIPGGRVFVLGSTADGPIFGSIISGIGLVETAGGIQIVRAQEGRPPVPIARFAP